MTGVDPETGKSIGTMTVSQLLASEPEAVLSKIGSAKPTEAQRAAVDQLYRAAEGFVRDATTATASAAKAGITRAQLKNDDIKKALKKLPGVKSDALDAAIAAAASR